MSQGFHMLCSFGLTYGVPMALAGREIWRTRRDGGAGWRDPTPVVPPAPKPLPACLIPHVPPRETRCVEDLELV